MLSELVQCLTSTPSHLRAGHLVSKLLPSSTLEVLKVLATSSRLPCSTVLRWSVCGRWLAVPQPNAVLIFNSANMQLCTSIEPLDLTASWDGVRCLDCAWLTHSITQVSPCLQLLCSVRSASPCRACRHPFAAAGAHKLLLHVQAC